MVLHLDIQQLDALLGLLSAVVNGMGQVTRLRERRRERIRRERTRPWRVSIAERCTRATNQRWPVPWE